MTVKANLPQQCILHNYHKYNQMNVYFLFYYTCIILYTCISQLDTNSNANCKILFTPYNICGESYFAYYTTENSEVTYCHLLSKSNISRRAMHLVDIVQRTGLHSEHVTVNDRQTSSSSPMIFC